MAIATTFPATETAAPNVASSLKRRMSPHAPSWADYGARAGGMVEEHQQLLHQQPQQPSFKRVRLSHNSPGELRLQRDLKSLTNSHQWNYQQAGFVGCWVHAQDPNIRLHQQRRGEQLLLEFSRDANITIRFPRMYPHQPPVVSLIEGLWMETILIRPKAPPPFFAQRDGGGGGDESSNGATTVIFDQWSPIVDLSALLEFLISHAKMHPGAGARAGLPRDGGCLGERTNTLHRHHHQPGKQPTDQHQQHHQQENIMMEVSYPCKYTSPFAPNRMNVGYHHHDRTRCYYGQLPLAASQDASMMEL